MDKYIGKLLDNRYEMLEILGVGGMAVVYKARDRVLDRFVAIKIMKDEFTNDEEFRRRFRNESQAVAKLSHNNIVSIFDVSPPNSPVQYIVMELIEGITLKNYLLRKGSLSWQETLFFAQQISKALSHAHSRGIIHQDIKPHNIILLRDGTVKVTDFGIARFEKNQETRVIQEAIGSVHYISPEQAKSARIDHRADLYSLGIVMYEMLTGRVPYDGDTPIAIVMQHINAQAPLPSTLVPDVPRGMDDIILHAMCPNLEERYTSAEEIYNDLERLKRNPSQRFFIKPEPPRPAASATDETIAIPRMEQPHSTYSTRPTSQSPSFHDPQPQDQVYRPRQRVEEDESERGGYEHRRKKKRSLTDSPAAMAGIAVAVFAIIAFGVGFFMMQAGNLFGSTKYDVPQLTGMLLDDARSQYGNQFQIQESGTRESSTAKEGEILEQDPIAGNKVLKNSVISVVVASAVEPEPIPEEPDTIILDESLIGGIIGGNYQYIENELSDLGLIVKLERRGDLVVEKDKVIETKPSIDTEFRKGDEITLVVSDGPDNVEVTVPYVVGKTFETAKAELEAAHLKVSRSEEYSDKPAGEVLGQSVNSETKVKANTEITLSVSKGPEQQPEPEPEEPEQQPSTPEVPSVDPEQTGKEDQPTTTQPDPEQSTPPTEEPVQEGSASISVPISGNIQVSVVAKIENRTVFEGMCDPSTDNPVTINLTGPVGKSETVDIFAGGKHSVQTVTYR